MCGKTKIEVFKDWTAAIASIITALSFLFAAYQFYLGRQVLQAQAIHEASKQALQLQIGMLQNAETFANMYGVNQPEFKINIAARQIIGFYVVLYRDWTAGLVDDDDWEAMKVEICSIKSIESIKSIVESAIQKRQYPSGFIEILKNC